MTVTIICCESIGVSGTTPVHVRQDGTSFEARVGIALLGSMNMDEAGFKACNHDPFHERFNDNYAAGTGHTQEEAIGAMKADMRRISDSLWD